MYTAGTQCLHILHWQNDSRRGSGSPEDTPRSSGASSIFDLRNLAADSLLPSLLERVVPEDVDRRNETLRRQHRPPALLTLYPAPDEVGAPSQISANQHLLGAYCILHVYSIASIDGHLLYTPVLIQSVFIGHLLYILCLFNSFYMWTPTIYPYIYPTSIYWVPIVYSMLI